MTDLEPLALLHEHSDARLRLPSELHRLYGGDLALPERCLYANFVATVDGVVAIPSLADSNALIAGHSAADRFVMGLLRAAADLVLVGSGTAARLGRADGGSPRRCSLRAPTPMRRSGASSVSRHGRASRS